MVDIEDVYDALHIALTEEGVDTAFADFTAGTGEYEPALHDLCYAAVEAGTTVPAELAGMLTAWLAEAGYPKVSAQFGALETTSRTDAGFCDT